RDGQTTGHIDLCITTGVDPAGGQQQYVIDLFPISTPSGEALAQLLAGGTVKLGQPVSTVVTVGMSGDTGSTDGTWTGSGTTTSQAFPQPNTVQVALTFQGGVLQPNSYQLTGSIANGMMTLVTIDSCGVMFNSQGPISGSSVMLSGENANDPSCAVQTLSC